MAKPAHDAELHLDPYDALGCAVIRQAVLDSTQPGMLGHEARAFLSGGHLDLWAELVGLDATGLRARLAKAHQS